MQLEPKLSNVRDPDEENLDSVHFDPNRSREGERRHFRNEGGKNVPAVWALDVQHSQLFCHIPHAHLPSKDLSAFQVGKVDRLLHLVLVAVSLMGGALVMALAGTWPSARREAATVAMFCMVTLVVAR